MILTHMYPTRWNQIHQRPPGFTWRSWSPLKRQVERDSSHLGYSSLYNSSRICLVALPGRQHLPFLPLVNFLVVTGHSGYHLRPRICFSSAIHAEGTDPVSPSYYQRSRNEPIGEYHPRRRRQSVDGHGTGGNGGHFQDMQRVACQFRHSWRY